MLFKEIIAVYSKNHTNTINTLYGYVSDLLNVKAGGMAYHLDFKD
jgi:hypothetical protein